MSMDGPTVAAAVLYLLDGTTLLKHLDSTERAFIRRAAELCDMLPVEASSNLLKRLEVVLQ